MATTNSLFYENPQLNQKIFFNSLNNSLTLSGVSLKVDPDLNQDTLTKVSVPYSPSSPGIEGQIAYDNNHLYLCVKGGGSGIASWVRSRLTNWSASEIISNDIPLPQYWWPFTSNGSSILPIEYDFTVGYPGVAFNFTEQDGLSTTAVPWGCLFNNTSPNLVEPSTNPQSFSVSFQTKRTVDYSSQPYSFLLGNAFGKLGFHFEFVNSDNTDRGNYISFSLGLHFPQPYVWARAISPSPLNLNTNYQIVGVHEFLGYDINNNTNGRLKLYINGALVSTTNYNIDQIGSVYENPWYQGCGLGCGTTWPGGAEYFSQIKIKNLGFWVNTALTQGAVSSLYNGGNFRAYPFTT